MDSLELFESERALFLPREEFLPVAQKKLLLLRELPELPKHSNALLLQCTPVSTGESPLFLS